MKAHFNTREFQLAHGRNPQGRGAWIFESADRTVTVEEDGKFAAARARVASAHPRVTEWVVQP